jgi:hypothetical protein
MSYNVFGRKQVGPIKQQPKLEINMDGLRKFKNYRNPEDDKVRSALEEAVKRLIEEGKPLVDATDDK